MPLEGYVMERIDQDVKDVLFGVHERASVRRSSMTAEEKVALEEKISEGKEARDREKRESVTKSTTPMEKTETALETVPDSTAAESIQHLEARRRPYSFTRQSAAKILQGRAQGNQRNSFQGFHPPPYS
ncbi:hypothetical protein Mapa_017261 [Marchantia paleacea]|nr:hypothetical protein Mapa_017261 [Marchantia paleacea]